MFWKRMSVDVCYIASLTKAASYINKVAEIGGQRPLEVFQMHGLMHRRVKTNRNVAACRRSNFRVKTPEKKVKEIR
jgi:hypothetical protein